MRPSLRLGRPSGATLAAGATALGSAALGALLAVAFAVAPAGAAQPPTAPGAGVPGAAQGPTGPGGPGTPATPTAPNGAPAPGTGALGPSGATGAAGQSAIPSSGDPLVANGLGSVICATPSLESQLSAQERGDCQTSSFVAAAAPTGNYAFDIHVDTGPLPGANTIALLFQELILTPIWLAFVWIVRALIVALEWCYTIDILQGPTMASVAGALHQAQATVTQPWLAAVLSVAALFALYHGIVRRRVAATVGELVLTIAMMAGGLWVIFNPAGTVGALAAWSNEASLDALAAVSQGTPAQPVDAFVSGMHDLFSEGIDAPWCYLEFGAVDWCRDPAQLDPRLRAAAIALAPGDAASSDPVYRDAALLLRRAQSNGDLFLALPANSLQRNSIVEQSSLLYVLCQSGDDTNCQGPTAAQAEFRTSSGTWARAGGLLLIAAGTTGLIALLAFISLRLIAAAVGSLLYLLLAPVAVLAPALGPSGRTAFRAWATRLIGAFTAKLLYSVLLGVVLLVLRILAGLSSVGWWAQWLLISSLWWSVVHHRHRLLYHATGGQIETSPQASSIGQRVLYRRGRIVPARLGRLPRIPRLPRLPSPDPKSGDRPEPGPRPDGKGGGGGSRGQRRGPDGGGRDGSDGRRRAGGRPGGRGSAGERGGDHPAERDAGGRLAGAGSGGESAAPGDGARRAGFRGRAAALGTGARRALSDRTRSSLGLFRRAPRGGSRPTASSGAAAPDPFVERALAHERSRAGSAAPLLAAQERDRGRLARINWRRAGVTGGATPRTRARLAQRAEALRAAIAERDGRLRTARSAAAEAGLDGAFQQRRRAEWAALLDRQARRPGALRARASAGSPRDYAALSPILGIDSAAYGALPPGEQRRARLAIDRALESRRDAKAPDAAHVAAAGRSASVAPPSAASVAPPSAASATPPSAASAPGRPGSSSPDRSPTAADGGRRQPTPPEPARESVVMRRERQFLRDLAERGERFAAPRRSGRGPSPRPPAGSG